MGPSMTYLQDSAEEPYDAETFVIQISLRYFKILCVSMHHVSTWIICNKIYVSTIARLKNNAKCYSQMYKF